MERAWIWKTEEFQVLSQSVYYRWKGYKRKCGKEDLLISTLEDEDLGLCFQMVTSLNRIGKKDGIGSQKESVRGWGEVESGKNRKEYE